MNNYFSHDSNARNSSKMLQVRMKYGAEGYGIYFMLLERLRDEDDYKSVKDYNAIAFDLRVDASIIKAVVEDFGLFVFTDDGKYFYSEGFNKRMAFKDEKSKRRSEAGKKGAQKRWANKDPRENDSNAMAKSSDQNSNTKAMPLHTDSKESKVNKSKVNKSKSNNNKKNKTKPRDPRDRIQQEFTEQVWSIYPKKRDFQKAYNAYYAAKVEGVSLETIVAKINEYKAYLKLHGTGEYYTKSLDNWLGGRGWMDEYDMTPPTQPAADGSNQTSKEAQTYVRNDF
ncbi:Lin1244/Lin1753 domain-containing protein [Lactiplantibacillus plantarum]|uniref:Lin1244/Lin1753 domain-containing protein n=1 Tax=Lactiplantibacillus plantarum TaxID=1590 RepID=UPI001CA3A461|nr:Lin1244/Lin1753 domain-containing protein [Lactiplantibacillus plantarum]MBY8574660.1 DUF4373 domain-containing protein [Lactiplantibacillus plantarum]